MTPSYGWGSTASRLQSNYKEVVYLEPVSSEIFQALVWSTSEGWKDELTLEPPAVLNTGPLDWESSAYIIIYIIFIYLFFILDNSWLCEIVLRPLFSPRGMGRGL